MSISARLVSIVVIIVAIIAAGWAIKMHGYRQGAEAVTKDWQADKAMQAEAILKARIAADKRVLDAEAAMAQAKARPAEIVTETIKVIKNEKTDANCVPSADILRVLNL